MPSGSANLRIARIPYAYTISRMPKIGAMMMLRIPDSRVPKKTKPTPGLCEKGLPKLEIAISTKSSAKIVRAAPRDLSGIEDSSYYFGHLRPGLTIVGCRGACDRDSNW